MKKSTIIITLLITVAILGITTYLLSQRHDDSLLNDYNESGAFSVEYVNMDYGFTFSLPDDWKGYSVVEDTWTWYPIDDDNVDETGPKLLMRNPLWTEELPYQDIPILIFTVSQWDSYEAGDFSVSAAPVPATELARNSSYVFALPPWWDFDYSEGYEEAERIVQSHPLTAFDNGQSSVLDDGRQCYAYSQEATPDAPYTVNEHIDITVQGNAVQGIKTGTQSGPDMTNGYAGTLMGTVNGDIIDTMFTYTIEGSEGKEEELYRISSGQVGLEKLRYPLVEKDGVLIPDTTKDFTTLLYARVGCDPSN